MVDEGGPSPALQGTAPRPTGMGCRRKLTEGDLESKPVRSILSAVCFSLLPQVPALTPLNDEPWTGNIR